MWDKDKIFGKVTLYNQHGEKEVRLRIGGWKNFLRFYVYINKISERDKFTKPVFNLPVNRIGVEVLVNELYILNEQPNDYVRFIEVSRPIWDEKTKKMTDEKALAGYLVVGRKEFDGEVVNFIGVKTPEGKRYYFKLLPTPYLRLLDNKGNPLPDSEASKRWTMAYASTFDKVLSMFPEVLPEPNENDNGKTTTKSYKKEDKKSSSTPSELEEFDF